MLKNPRANLVRFKRDHHSTAVHSSKAEQAYKQAVTLAFTGSIALLRSVNNCLFFDHLLKILDKIIS